MRTLAILPIKTFDAAKQRLASRLGGGSRHALAQAMFSDVLAALRHVPGLDAVLVVTSDDRARAAATGERVQVIEDTAQSGHSEAAQLGVRHALAAGYERVLLVPGDAPLLDPLEVEALLERADAEGTAVAIIPDRHGSGTNGLLIAPPDCFEPSFGPGSCERHLAAARADGLAHRLEPLSSLAHDVDTPEDLADLAAVLESRRGSAPSTRGALAQLERSRITVAG